MSTERDVAPLLRSWLRSDADGTVDHVIDAILAEVDATPQRSATWWPARRPDMNMMMKFGIAAAVLAMTAAIGYGLWQNLGKVTPPPEASAAPEGVDAGLPPEWNHVFVTATRDVPGLDVDDRLVMDLTSGVFRLYTSQANPPRLTSAASVTADGRLRLETVGGATGCDLGDVGTFDYSFSAGRTVLTVASGKDDCASRGAAVEGEWRRSACNADDNWCLGVLEAGTQSSLFFDPFAEEWGAPVTRHGAMVYEVPDGWANADDRTHFYTLLKADAYTDARPFECLDCPDGVWIGANPAAATMDCAEEADQTVGTSAEALADWVRAHPGLQVTADFANQGRAGSGFTSKTTLDIEASESYGGACEDPENGVSHVPLFAHPGYVYGIRTGDRVRLILVEIDADSAMLIGIDSFDPDDLESVIEDTQPIIDSIRLTPP